MFFTILLLLLLFGYLFIRLVPYLLARKVQRMQRQHSGGTSSSSPSAPEQAPKKKLIDDSEGDYVEFEEIK